VLEILRTFPEFLIQSFVSFLSSAIDKTWARSSTYGNFEGYRQNVEILLDLLATFDTDSIPPVLIEVCARQIERIAPFLDIENSRRPGTAFRATNLWFRRENAVDAEVWHEIRVYCLRHGCDTALPFVEHALNEE